MRIFCRIDNSITDIVTADRTGQYHPASLGSNTNAVLANLLVRAVLPP
jgi:hypothetical protein